MRITIVALLWLTTSSLFARHEFFSIIGLKGKVEIYQQETSNWISINNRNYYQYDLENRKTTFFKIYAHDSIKLGDGGNLILLDNFNQKYLEITSKSSFEAKSLHHDIKKEFKKHSEVHATEWFYPIIESMFDTVNFHSIKAKLECQRCITTYNIIAPPSGVYINKNLGEVKFRWKPYPNATEYEFFVNNFFGEHIFQKKTLDSSMVVNITSLYDPNEENQLFWGSRPDSFNEGTLNYNSIIIAPDEMVAKIDAEYAEHALDTSRSVFDKFLAATIYYKNGFYFDSGKIYTEIADKMPDVFTYQILMIHNQLLLGEISEESAHNYISSYYKKH